MNPARRRRWNRGVELAAQRLWAGSELGRRHSAAHRPLEVLGDFLSKNLCIRPGIDRMTDGEYGDFLFELYDHVRCEATLASVPRGITNHGGLGRTTRGPWRPADCSWLLQRWHEQGLVTVWQLAKSPAPDRELSTAGARSVLADPRQWTSTPDGVGMHTVRMSERGYHLELQDWMERVSADRRAVPRWLTTRDDPPPFRPRGFVSIISEHGGIWGRGGNVPLGPLHDDEERELVDTAERWRWLSIKEARWLELRLRQMAVEHADDEPVQASLLQAAALVATNLAWGARTGVYPQLQKE